MFEKLFTVMYYSIYKYCCVLRFDTYLRLYVVFHKSKLFISMQCFLSFAKTKILRENVMKYLNALSLSFSLSGMKLFPNVYIVLWLRRMSNVEFLLL